MDFTGPFQFTPEYLNLFTPSLQEAIIGIALLVLIGIILRKINIMGMGVYLIYTDLITDRNRQKMLGDLILMKDIQTELDQEIADAKVKQVFRK